MHDSANAATAPVAVIIPCYNYGRFIGSTIETVLAQTLRPAEIIIVDDGSTDQTREVCEQYDGVRYIWKENGGVSSARNLGLAESTSEYVMFPDADDVLSPKAVEILWDANRALGGSAPAVYGSTTRFSDWQGWLDAQSSDVPIPQDVAAHTEREVAPGVYVLSRTLLERLVERNIVPQCGAMIARSVYDRIGLWDERFYYHQDRDIWIRICSEFEVGYVNRLVAGIRVHGDNITNPKNWIRNHDEIVALLDAVIRSDWADRYLRRLARQRYVSTAYLLGRRLARSGEFRRAAELMWKSWVRSPLRLKTVVFHAAYSARAAAQPKTRKTADIG